MRSSCISSVCHFCHLALVSSVMGSSQFKFRQHSSCRMDLPCKKNEVTKSRGSKRELMVDKMPRVVHGLSWRTMVVQYLAIALVWFHAVRCGVACCIYSRSTWTCTLMISDWFWNSWNTGAVFFLTILTFHPLMLLQMCGCCFCLLPFTRLADVAKDWLGSDPPWGLGVESRLLNLAGLFFFLSLFKTSAENTGSLASSASCLKKFVKSLKPRSFLFFTCASYANLHHSKPE